MSFLVFKNNRFLSQLKYICDLSLIPSLTLLTSSILFKYQAKRTSMPSLAQHITLEILVLTHGIC